MIYLIQGVGMDKHGDMETWNVCYEISLPDAERRIASLALQMKGFRTAVGPFVAMREYCYSLFSKASDAVLPLSVWEQQRLRTAWTDAENAFFSERDSRKEAMHDNKFPMRMALTKIWYDYQKIYPDPTFERILDNR